MSTNYFRHKRAIVLKMRAGKRRLWILGMDQQRTIFSRFSRTQRVALRESTTSWASLTICW